MPPTDDRRQAIALFRYALIREAADPALGTRERGALIRAPWPSVTTSARPVGRVRVSRNTLDRWIRAWRVGGFPALLPTPGSADPRGGRAAGAGGDAQARAAPPRAAQIARVITEQCGTGPHERTLQRHFRRVGLDRELATEQERAARLRPVPGRGPQPTVDR